MDRSEMEANAEQLTVLMRSYVANAVEQEIKIALDFVAARAAEIPPTERPTGNETKELTRRLIEEATRARKPPPPPDNATPESAVNDPAAKLEALVRDTPVYLQRLLASQVGTGLEAAWPTVFRAWQQENAERLAAKCVLAEANDDDLAARPEAAGRLEQAVRESLAKVPEYVTVPDDLGSAGEKDGMFALDADLAEFIENQRIADAQARANQWREQWREQWQADRQDCIHRWESPLRVARVLARVLWSCKVRIELERERERPDAPGIIDPALTNLAMLSRIGAAAQRGAQLNFINNTARLTDKRGRLVGEIRMDAPSVDGSVVKLGALHSLASQRILRWAICEGYKKRFIEQDPSYATLEIIGGTSALARHFGLNGKRRPDELREALDAWSSVWINTPKGEGRIFAAYHHKPAPGRPARLEIHLLGPLRPGYVQEELANHRVSSDKRIVPIPMPDKLPPMIGRDNEHAAQALFQLLVLREFRINAEEMAETGAVAIDDRQWTEIADEASLPKSMIRGVLEAFATGQGAAPADPFLVRPSKERFGLAEAYDRERRAILAAAEAATRGRTRGQKSARKRRVSKKQQ
jgi:hypothetical protein